MVEHISNMEVFYDFVDDVAEYAETLWLAYPGCELTPEEMDQFRELVCGFFNDKRYKEGGE
jgi:hypothetical protein